MSRKRDGLVLVANASAALLGEHRLLKNLRTHTENTGDTITSVKRTPREEEAATPARHFLKAAWLIAKRKQQCYARRAEVVTQDIPRYQDRHRDL